MNLRQFLEWAQTLPPDFQDADLLSGVTGMPLANKRIIAFRDRDGGTCIVTNPMGCHFQGDVLYHPVSTLNFDGQILTPGIGDMVQREVTPPS